MDEKPIGQQIAEFRAKHRLDQTGFAKGCGYSKKHIQHMEHGRRNPSAAGQERILTFMATATPAQIASLRGPGPGNSMSEARRGRKLRRHEIGRSEIRDLTPDELDNEVSEMLKKF